MGRVGAPEDEGTGEILKRAGHLLDSAPLRMAARIDDLDLGAVLDLDLDPDPTWETVARCNDQGHGVLDDWSMSALFTEIEDPASQLYVARSSGRPRR